MSSTNKTTNYQLSQFVGNDIPSILNDYNGDMRKIDNAIHDASVAGGDNATAISELQATTGRITTEVGGINSTVNSLSGRVVGIEDDITEMQEQIDDMGGDVKAIQLCVPSDASADNQLATKSDVGQLIDIYSINYNPNTAGTFNDFLKSVYDGLTNLVENTHPELEDYMVLKLWIGSHSVEPDARHRLSFYKTTSGNVRFQHFKGLRQNGYDFFTISNSTAGCDIYSGDFSEINYTRVTDKGEEPFNSAHFGSTSIAILLGKVTQIMH